MRATSGGQTILEYSIVTVIVVAAFITMQMYIKRGFQGRWKASVDDLGEQYDPRSVSSSLRTVLLSNSITSVTIVPVSEGAKSYYTLRTDHSLMNEARTGTVEVGNSP